MALVWTCRLDVAGIVKEYIHLDDSLLQPTDVWFATKPDLKCGEYRWNGETFVPCATPKLYAPDGPDAWYAVYRTLRRLEKQNIINMPAPTKQWMDYYRQAFTTDPAVEP